MLDPEFCLWRLRKELGSPRSSFRSEAGEKYRNVNQESWCPHQCSDHSGSEGPRHLPRTGAGTDSAPSCSVGKGLFLFGLVFPSFSLELAEPILCSGLGLV